MTHDQIIRGPLGSVLICSGGRYESQANEQVRSSIEHGWAEYIGSENVISANIIGAGSVVSEIKPDLIIAIGSYLPESTYFGELSREARRLKKPIVFWATEDPYEQDANYRITQDFDAIFSCDHWGMNFYRHPNVFHLPLAGCGKKHFVPINKTQEKTIDVMFCGVAFTSRQEIVEDLRPVLRGLDLCFIGPGWGRFGPGFSDRRIDKDQLIDLYTRSKIVLNLGRSLHFENRRYMITPSSPGPRTFEVALAGALQFFHEDTYEMHRYFSRAEIPTFSNPVDFELILNSYLHDGQRRTRTAELAQKRAISEHTYGQRAQAMVAMLRARGLV